MKVYYPNHTYTSFYILQIIYIYIYIYISYMLLSMAIYTYIYTYIDIRINRYRIMQLINLYFN